MERVVIAGLVGIAVYIALLALMPKHILTGGSQYTRNMLQKLARVMPEEEVAGADSLSVLRAQTRSKSLLARIFFILPGANALYPHLLKAGLGNSIGRYFISCIAILLISLYFLSQLGLGGIAGSVAITLFFGRGIVKRRITKRNNAFLHYFPDALDMIVRSVRSGYPLNSAVRMVADNMQAPVSTEFKQVADEVAYGSTLIEGLQRLSLRIDEPDVRFFVVVLTVQQDVGGNLSEVLNNLSGIIRKRKYLRMKIKALASEGRATAWVLGSLPFVEAGLLLVIAPSHLAPLVTTALGHKILGATIAVVATGILIVRQMVNIKV